MTFTINKNIAISENGFLFNPATGESFTINPPGVRLISLLKEGLTDEEIIRTMSEEFEADKRDLERDLIEFREVLKFNHLIIEDE